MLSKEENLETALGGMCLGCKTPQKIPFREVWDVNTLYKIGTCPSCEYEHQLFVKKSI
jgi:hypothetical protein